MQRRIILLLALLCAFPLLAQTKRLVSRIDVRGNVPAEIVTSQTALAEGRSYSDRDLDLAMARLRRLPFVFDATWSADGDTLVIEVNPMSRFFGDLTGIAAGTEGDRSTSAELTGGGRHFLGRGGVAQAHVTQTLTEGRGQTFADAEYSHYGIAGTRLWARGAVGYSLRNENGFEPDPTWSVDVGYPLTVRQSLTASWIDSGYRINRSFPDGPALNGFSNFNATRLLWTWDTSEDPFFARTGEIINAGPSWAKQSTESGGFVFIGPNGEIFDFGSRSESETTSFTAEARKYFATGTRGTVFGGLAATAFRTENSREVFGPIPFEPYEVDGNAVSLSGGYAYNFFDWSARPSTRHRAEVGATYRRNTFDQVFSDDVTVDSYTVDAAYVLRRQYATVRFQLSYLFD